LSVRRSLLMHTYQVLTGSLLVFYRERYLLAEADPVVEKELHAGLHENPARVIPALGNIR
jgi:hypothetical protein